MVVDSFPDSAFCPKEYQELFISECNKVLANYLLRLIFSDFRCKRAEAV